MFLNPDESRIPAEVLLSVEAAAIFDELKVVFCSLFLYFFCLYDVDDTFLAYRGEEVPSGLFGETV